MTAAERIRQARANAEKLEPALADAYQVGLLAAGRRAGRLFSRLATRHLTAAAAVPDWSPPDPAELVDAAAVASIAKRGRTTQHRVIETVVTDALQEIGVSFDVTHPLSQALLARVGAQAERLAAGVRDTVRAAIADAFDRGLTVADTAKAIAAAVKEAAPWQARMLARTDLISLSNGGALLAARITDAASAEAGEPLLETKSWLTAGDERVRECHADTDGQTVPLDEAFDVCGEALQYPGDPDGSDEQVINCRCVMEFGEPLTASGALAAVDFTEGSMIAVYPSPDQAAALARSGGQPSDDLHCTLAFLPDGLTDQQAADLAGLLTDAAVATLEGVVGGLGAFAATEDAIPVIALPDVVGLNELRTSVVEALDAVGATYATSHGFCPHITLMYVEDPGTVGEIVAGQETVGQTLTFGAVSIVRGPDRTDVPLATQTSPSQEAAMNQETLTAAAVTITLDEPDTEAADAPRGWNSPTGIAFENLATSDDRFFMPGSWGWRDLPLTLMAMVETGPGGHQGAEIAGRIDMLEKAAVPELGDGVVGVRASGIFDAGEYGQEIARMVGDRTLRGISVDFSVEDYCFRDPGTGQIYEPDAMTEDEWMRAFVGDLQFAARAATIAMATVCPFPAFEDAAISLVADGSVTLQITFPLVLGEPSMLASAQAPVAPPRDWFFRPEARELTPITVTEDGEVFGHAASWGCHNGHPDRCMLAPRSSSGYAYFHTGELQTAEGDLLPIGRMLLAPHAPPELSRNAAQRHYSDLSSVAAFVRAVDGVHGVWVSGVLRNDLTVEQVRDFRANPPSGDWRAGELLVFNSVPAPGLPVPRPQAFLVASADGGVEVATLLAAGVVCDCDETAMNAAAVDAEMQTLAAVAEGGIEALAELAGV